MNFIYSLLILAFCLLVGYGIMKIFDAFRANLALIRKPYRVLLLLATATLLGGIATYSYLRAHLDVSTFRILIFVIVTGATTFLLLLRRRYMTDVAAERSSINGKCRSNGRRLVYPRRVLVRHIIGLQLGSVGIATLIFMAYLGKNFNNCFSDRLPLLYFFLTAYAAGTAVAWLVVWRELRRYVPSQSTNGEHDHRATV